MEGRISETKFEKKHDSTDAQIGKLYSPQDDFDLWIRRFEIYANITATKDENHETKVASLISMLDDVSFRLFQLL